MEDLNKFNSFIKKLKIFQVYPSVYDPISGMNEFGPYGATIKNNLVEVMKREFRKFGFWEVDCPLISPTIVWKASGHLDRFVDIIAESDGKIYRIENIIEEKFPNLALKEKGLEGLSKLIKEKNIIPIGNKEPLHNAQEYNLMLTTSVARTPAVLRPETATTTYLAFRDYYNLFREQMPIKIFQYGRAFRNEITSKQGLIRGREFEQLEGQIFILEEQKNSFDEFNEIKDTTLSCLDSKSQQQDLGERVISLEEALKEKLFANEAFAYCFYIVSDILEKTGIKKDAIRFRQHLPDEKAHYALDAWDVEVATQQYGLVEVCGVHDRNNYDLTRHQDFSKKNFSVRNSKGEYEIPHILEIAFGVGRMFYCILEQNFGERDEKNVLYLPKKISPIHSAVFPLVNKEGLDNIARKINKELINNGFISIFDKVGSIGKRYARMDELGTPYCFTVDFQTKEDNSITIRDRDTTNQYRIPIDEASLELYKKLNE